LGIADNLRRHNQLIMIGSSEDSRTRDVFFHDFR
jgi:hypothetical protein